MFRPVSWLIASQMRCTRFFDGVGAEIGPSRLGRVALSERIPQEVELFGSLQTRVFVSFTVNFSFVIMSRIVTKVLLGPVPTTDHKIIGIVNDVRFQTSLVPQVLPPEHEPAHVQITQQRSDRRKP